MSKNTSPVAFNRLVKQLSAKTIEGLQITELKDYECFPYWSYRGISSHELLRGNDGYFNSALEALLDFTLWLKENHDLLTLDLLTLDSDL